MKKIYMPLSLVIVVNMMLASCGGNSAQTPEVEMAKEPIAEKVDNEDEQPFWRKIKRAGEANGNRYFTDDKGNKLFNGAVFHNAHEFRNGYCVVSMKGDDGKDKHGIIDENGKFILECINDFFIRDFQNGFFEIANPKIGYLNEQGAVVIPMEYTSSKGFSHGMVKLEKQYRKWGILNDNGEEVVPFIYDDMGGWKQNLTAVKKGSKWGFIDLQGKEIIPCQYDMAYGFEHGISLVRKGKNYGFINLQGETVIDFIYSDYKEVVDVSKDEISETGYSQSNNRLVMEEGYIVLKKEGKWGYIDTLGNEVVPFEYDYIGLPSRSGTIQIEKNKRRGSYDLKLKKETLR